MIDIQDKVFHLRTDHYSYLLRINDFGQPEHLHFGAPVRTEDHSGFLCRPGLGWGGSVVLDDSSPASCADDKALEWSGSGRGDYRESPLELAGQSTDFRFVGAETVKGPVVMISIFSSERGFVFLHRLSPIILAAMVLPP